MYLTYSMEQGSWIADSYSPSHEIPRHLWNKKIHCRVHNSPPPVPIPRQLNPIHTLTSYFYKIHFNIILISTCKFSQVVSFLMVSWVKMLYAFLISPMRGTCPKYTKQVVADSRQGVVFQLWGLGAGLTNLRCKKPACYEMLHRASHLAGFCEHGNEPSCCMKGGEEFLD
jgi:hypothetical protein